MADSKLQLAFNASPAGKIIRICKSCTQKSDDYDKDYLPVLVQIRWRSCRGGVPAGDECQECNNVRVYNLGGIGYQECLDLRRSNKALDERFLAMRHKNCITVGRRSYEKIDLTTYQKDEGFLESWQDGEFIELAVFLTESHIDVEGMSLEQMTTIVKEDLKVEVVEVEGEVGVIILDAPAGHKKVRQGRRVASGKSRVSILSQDRTPHGQEGSHSSLLVGQKECL